MRNKIIIAAILAFFTAPLCADKMALDNDPGRAPAADGQATTPSVQTAAAYSSMAATVKANDTARAAKIRSLSDGLDEIKSKQSELAASVAAAQDEIKIIEERSPEIDALNRDAASLKDRLDAVEKNEADNKQAVEKAAKDMNSFMDETNQNIDKLQGWNDIIDVLKKSISDNETEIAEVRKSIKELKHDYDADNDSPLAQVLKWPYAGFAAMLVSIIALGVAVARR
jgi:archaellum component FlaC